MANFEVEHYEHEEGVIVEGIAAADHRKLEEGGIIEIPNEQEDKLFSCLGLDLHNVTIMRVKHGSKVRNLLGFAFKKIKAESTKYIIFTGSGPAISKTITCVEIVKRNMKTLHQISKIFYKRIEEYWNPKEEELDRLKVTRHIPAIAILLSKESLDSTEPGYQAPGSYSALWTDETQDKTRKTSQARKRASSEKTKQTKRTAQSGSKSEGRKREEGGRRRPSSKKTQATGKGNKESRKEDSRN